jgi:hypothetical protein
MTLLLMCLKYFGFDLPNPFKQATPEGSTPGAGFR